MEVREAASAAEPSVCIQRPKHSAGPHLYEIVLVIETNLLPEVCSSKRAILPIPYESSRLVAVVVKTVPP